MPRNSISTSSRATTVSLRGGSGKRTTSTRTYTRPYRRSGRYASKVTRLPMTRRMNSWTPRVSKPKINIPQYVLANHNAFHSKAEGVKVRCSSTR